MRASEIGRRGELAAAEHLRRAGCEILTANYRTRQGEIDIVASDGRYLLFVEVKTRRSGSLIAPREAVDAGKRRRLILAAQAYLAGHPTRPQPRFDVIEVETEPGPDFCVRCIRQIPDAFGV